MSVFCLTRLIVIRGLPTKKEKQFPWLVYQCQVHLQTIFGLKILHFNPSFILQLTTIECNLEYMIPISSKDKMSSDFNIFIAVQVDCRIILLSHGCVNMA